MAGWMRMLTSRRAIALTFFFLILTFQVQLVIRVKALYLLMEILFAALLLFLIGAVIRASVKAKAAIFVFIFIIGLRLPFFLSPSGMITTSDNALDALQCQEIQETRLAPFFLLDAVRHTGTAKYALTAFLWDFLGRNYLFYLFVQVVLCAAIIYFLYERFKASLDHKTFVLLLFFHFAFIETFFDNSLSIRAGSEFEMFFFFLLGLFLFDFRYESRLFLFLAYDFMFFSIYIHPLAATLVASFILCAFVYSLKNRKVGRNLIFMGAGAAAGLFHWFYYLAFHIKPPASGSWEAFNVIPLSGLSFRLIRSFFLNFQKVFWNIFSFEFSYLKNIYMGTFWRRAASVLNQALIYLSLAILITALAIAVRKAWRLVAKKDVLEIKNWASLFFIVLFAALAVKCVAVSPPLVEPRHNLDAVFLVILSYCIVFSYVPFLRVKNFFSLKTLALTLLFLAFTLPHYQVFLKQARHKEMAYKDLLAVLSKNRVKYLATDFIIAYPVHFLSSRRILVSDSIGPFTIRNFYPEMRARVDAIPADQKSYLFFSENYPQREWHKQATYIVRETLRKRLEESGILFRVHKLQDFTVFIPSHRRFSIRSE
jgi:hypothetical protein